MVRVGSELNDTSIKLGIATNALQEYRFAAQQVGVSAGELDSSFKFLAKSSFDAATGGKESIAVYKRLGVAFKDANGNARPSEELFTEVAAAISGLDNEAEKTALALKIFGRGGQALLPLMAQGAEGIEKLRQEARDLGGGFDPEFIENADALGDNLDKLGFSGDSLKSRLGNALLPTINRIVLKMLDWSKAIQRVLQGSKLFQMGLIAITAATVAWGLASIVAGRQAIIAWLAAAAPFLIVAAALTAISLLLDDVHAMLTGGKSLIGQYIDEWAGIGTVDRLVRQWWSGIEGLKGAIDGLMRSTADSVAAMGDLFSGDFKGFATKYAAQIAREAKTMKDSLVAVDHAIAIQHQAPAERMAGRGINAALAGDEHTPRMTGRGMGAALAAGSAGFGQASQESVRAFAGPGAAKDSKGGHGVTVNQHNESTVQVNAHTGANPKEIARQAKRAARELQHEQARNVRAALTNKVPKDG